MAEKKQPMGTVIAGAGRGLLMAKLAHQHGERILAMVDKNEAIHEKLRAQLRSYGCEDTVVLSSFAAALERFPAEAAPAVMVVTPNTTHAELFEQAIAAKRHVLLEKPVATHEADLLRIERAAAQAPELVVQLGFVLRYSVFFRKIKSLIDAGVLGRVIMMQLNERLEHSHGGGCYRRAWRRLIVNTGGFINEKCSHDIDILCWLKDRQAEPVSVYSLAGHEMFPRREDRPDSCPDCDDAACPFRCRYERIFGQEFQLHVDETAEQRCVFRSDADVYNHQSLTIGFADGTQGLLTAIAYTGRPDRDIVIHGTEGFLAGTLSSGKLELCRYREGLTPEAVPMPESDMHGGGDPDIVAEFYNCIRTGAKPDATLADGIRASRIAFAADKSAATGQAVRL